MVRYTQDGAATCIFFSLNVSLTKSHLAPRGVHLVSLKASLLMHEDIVFLLTVLLESNQWSISEHQPLGRAIVCIARHSWTLNPYYHDPLQLSSGISYLIRLRKFMHR